jgi:hypothetical protein
LPLRFARPDAPLNPYNRDTFYTPDQVSTAGLQVSQPSEFCAVNLLCIWSAGPRLSLLLQYFISSASIVVQVVGYLDYPFLKDVSPEAAQLAA